MKRAVQGVLTTVTTIYTNVMEGEEDEKRPTIP